MKTDIEKIGQLRKQTGLSFAEIKRALDEAKGDMAGAIEVLKAHGAIVAEKKSSRETAEGVIDTYIHSNNKIGSMVELYCETDFVAKNDEFKKLAHEIAMQIASMNPRDEKELLKQRYIRDQDITIQEFIQQYIAKLGENIKVGNFIRFEI